MSFSDFLSKARGLFETDSLHDQGRQADAGKPLPEGSEISAVRRRPAGQPSAWGELRRVFKEGESVSGTVTEASKAGLVADVNGIRVIIPMSEIDVGWISNPAGYIGKTLELYIIEMDDWTGRVIATHREVAEEDLEDEGEEAAYEEGEIVLGKVVRIVDYGAFVDLGSAVGLIHISNLTWGKIRHPSEVVNVGQEVSVKILQNNRESGKLSLGLKQATEDPWKMASLRFHPGTIAEGQVKSVFDYGAFVQLAPGIDGLVHRSELDWGNKKAEPAKYLRAGQRVPVYIMSIDRNEHKIALSLMRCKESPWEKFLKQHPIGSFVRGKIEKITNFGVFVGLGENVYGLIHVSNMRWDESGEDAVRKYRVGNEIGSIVLDVDIQQRRISLGLRQLSGFRKN